MPDASTQTRRGKKIVLLKEQEKREEAMDKLVDAHVELVKKYRELKKNDLQTKISKWMSDPNTMGDSIYDFLCDECGCKMD